MQNARKGETLIDIQSKGQLPILCGETSQNENRRPWRVYWLNEQQVQENQQVSKKDDCRTKERVRVRVREQAEEKREKEMMGDIILTNYKTQAVDKWPVC